MHLTFERKMFPSYRRRNFSSQQVICTWNWTLISKCRNIARPNVKLEDNSIERLTYVRNNINNNNEW